jgi:two-component system sensor histidine kinase KdpD
MIGAAAATRRAWFLTLGALVVVTAGLVAVRDAIDRTHVALAYLLLVLAVSSRAGRVIGVAASVAAFLCFNFFFVAPHYRLTVASRPDWAMLGAFLLTSFIAAQLLTRARGEAAAAQVRAREVERLSALGAETLNAPRAEDALRGIAEVIRVALDAAACEVYVREREGSTTLVVRAGGSASARSTRPLGQPSFEQIVAWVAANGRMAVERSDGSMRVGDAGAGLDAALLESENAATLLLPLRARECTVGVLSVRRDNALHLDSGRRQFLEALSYYAALAVERVQLTKDGDRADALQKADDMKNAVLASVSHDLRTPLTTIKALAHEIRRDGDDRAATIEEEADRLNRLVADLLDLSRLAGGAVRVKAEINAAEDLIGAALERVSGVMGDRTILASLDPSDPLLLGRFDFVHSLRVLCNLIENAAKFSPPQSQVEVRARRDNGALEFVVEDRGPGVPAADREVVFQPFMRRAGGMPDVGGSGLGLSIARGLAEAQGGTVRYEDRHGGGSRFVFAVPAADSADMDFTTPSL